MQQHTKIHEYLNVVCEQIRWKKAHSVISQEIENHIIDQKAAFVAQGYDEAIAEENAIKEMGDPISIGTQLNRVYKPKFEWSIVVLTAIMLLIGVAVHIFIYYYADSTFALNNRFLGIFIGIICMVIAYFVDFTILEKYSIHIFIMLVILAIASLLWSPHFQGQSYYTKYVVLLFPIAFTGIVYKMRNRGYLGIIMSGAFFSVLAIICLSIPSLSSLLLVSISCITVITIAIKNNWFNVRKSLALLLVYIPTVVVIILGILATFGRLQVAINPSIDPMNGGWQGVIIREIISGAVFIGNGGALNTDMKPQFFIADFLLTYLINRIGWISFIVIVGLLLAFIVRAFILCARQKSVLGKLVATSVVTVFAIQVGLYIASNLGFIFFTPVGLPFISFGRNSMIVSLFLVGILLSVFKSGDLVQDTVCINGQRQKLFEMVDGNLVIYLHRQNPRQTKFPK